MKSQENPLINTARNIVRRFPFLANKTVQVELLHEKKPIYVGVANQPSVLNEFLYLLPIKAKVARVDPELTTTHYLGLLAVPLLGVVDEESLGDDDIGRLAALRFLGIKLPDDYSFPAIR